MDDLVEKWRIIVGYDNYAISNLGRVRNLTTGKELKWQMDNRGGHPSIKLSNKVGRHSFIISMLVARYFIGERPYMADLRYRDHDKSNPRVDNLEYYSVDDRGRPSRERYVSESDMITKVFSASI